MNHITHVDYISDNDVRQCEMTSCQAKYGSTSILTLKSSISNTEINIVT